MKINIQGNIPKHIMDEVEKLKPSSDPAYWAKKGCKDCLGRGVVGKQTLKTKGDNTIINSLLCGCARKKYRAWVEKTADEMKTKKVDLAGKEKGSNGNGKEEEKEKGLRSRLSDLDDAIHNIKIEIALSENEISSYPHHQQLEEIGGRQKAAEVVMQALTNDVENWNQKITSFTERARRLMTAAKSLARDAAAAQQERDTLLNTKVKQQRIAQQVVQAEYRVVEKDLNSQTHKAKRRHRIALDRLDKLVERRQKVIRESGFDPVSFIESMVLQPD
ncbi:hypothetical protein MUP59_01040 [Candidatus Bathyarchaeota archaeon]|nr:hypothetical protein [Candidatus Bathyarchaeota archaeon]